MEGEKKVQELQNQEKDVLSQINEREEQIAKAKAEIQAAEAKNEAETNQLIADLKEIVKTSQEEIAKLKSTLTSVRSDLNTLQEQIEASKTKIDQQLGTSAETQTSAQSEEKIDQKPDSTPQVSSPNPQTAQTSTTSSTWTTTTTSTATNTTTNNATASDTPQPEAPQTPDTAKEPENKSQETTESKTTPENPEVKPETKTEEKPAEKAESPQQNTEIQQEQQINAIFESLTQLPLRNDGLYLSSAQIQQLFLLDALVKQASQQIKRDYTYDEMLANPDLIDEQIANNKEQTKANKQLHKQLKKLNKSEEKLAKSENRVNYQGQKLANTRNIRAILATWAYLDGTVHFPKEQRLAFELYKNREKLRTQACVPLNVNGETIPVYNQEAISSAGEVAWNLANCNQPKNVVEKLLVEHTKMNLQQARSATNTIATVGAIGAGFLALKWLLGDTDKETKERKFWLSWKKFAALIGIPLALNYGSQAATGKWLMDHLNALWKDGTFPRENKEKFEQTPPLEQIAIGQNTVQTALLGVPYSQLALIAKPNSWPVLNIDLGQLKNYYEQQIALARTAQNTQQVNTLGTQLTAVNALLGNQNGQNLLNSTIANMQINAADLANPQNAALTLDTLLNLKNQNTQALEAYLWQQNLTIAPEKKTLLEQKLLSATKPLTDSDFEAFAQEGLLIANDKFAQEFNKLNIDPLAKQKLNEAIRTFANSAEFANINITAIDAENLKLTSNQHEITLNAKTLKIPGLVNSGNQEIPLSSPEELIRLGLYINKIKEKFWNQTPDLAKRQASDWPFAQPQGRENLAAWQGIIFKKAGSTENVIDSSIPFFGEMNTFPTIEKQENRQFLINYLNTARKNKNQ